MTTTVTTGTTGYSIARALDRLLVSLARGAGRCVRGPAKPVDIFDAPTPSRMDEDEDDD